MPKVHHIPNFQKNLMSISQLTLHNNCDVTFTETGRYITRHRPHAPPQHTLEAFSAKYGLYHLRLSIRSLVLSNDKNSEHHQHTGTANNIKHRKNTIIQYFRA